MDNERALWRTDNTGSLSFQSFGAQFFFSVFQAHITFKKKKKKGSMPAFSNSVSVVPLGPAALEQPVQTKAEPLQPSSITMEIKK